MLVVLRVEELRWRVWLGSRFFIRRGAGCRAVTLMLSKVRLGSCLGGMLGACLVGCMIW